MARGGAGRRDKTLGQHYGERPAFEVLVGFLSPLLLLVPHLSVLLAQLILFVQGKRRRVLDVEHSVLCGGGGGCV